MRERAKKLNGTLDVDGGFQNYNIYIREAFLGWNGYPGLTVIAGKQDLPFYATTLFWDQIKMFPQGLVERIDFDQLLGWNSDGEPVSYSKDGKAPPSAPAKHYGALLGQYWRIYRTGQKHLLPAVPRWHRGRA